MNSNAKCDGCHKIATGHNPVRILGLVALIAIVHLAIRAWEPSPARAAHGGPPSFSTVVQQANPSIAHVIVRLRNERSRKSRDDAVGAGFVVSSDGLVLTSRHVLKGAKQIVVDLPGREPQLARVVREDEASDLALLRIPLQGLRPIAMGDSRTLQVGDWVVAAGSPYHLKRSWSVGIVSALGRTNVGRAGKSGVRFIQTDAAANLGNSGGPLLDADGRVVGVMTAILSKSSGHQGVALATPINYAQRFVGRSLGSVVRSAPHADLGLSLQSVRGGVLVTRAPSNLRAYAAGIRRGDILVSVDGQAVRRPDDVYRAVMIHRGDGLLQVTFLRDGATAVVSIPLR